MPTIEPLADHPALVPVVARWHWDAWGAADPGGSAEAWADRLRATARRDGVPATWVAFADGAPAGSVSLVAHDMRTHPELTPWLAGLFVVAEQRGRGLGTALVRRAMDAAAGWGVGRLFLHTATASTLYRRLGWAALSRELYEGEWVDVMQARLAPTACTDGSPGRSA